jgi:hypothetical protein
MKVFLPLKQRCVAWIWGLTPNCADMARLASESLDKALPLGLRLRMRLHFLVCVWCARYFKQLKFLRENAPHLEHRAIDLPGLRLSLEARRRIVQHLQNAPGKCIE